MKFQELCEKLRINSGYSGNKQTEDFITNIWNETNDKERAFTLMLLSKNYGNYGNTKAFGIGPKKHHQILNGFRPPLDPKDYITDIDEIINVLDRVQIKKLDPMDIKLDIKSFSILLSFMAKKLKGYASPKQVLKRLDKEYDHIYSKLNKLNMGCSWSNIVSDDSPVFTSIKPMLSTLIKDPIEHYIDSDYSIQPKIDGIRGIAIITPASPKNVVSLYSRQGKDITSDYKLIISELMKVDTTPLKDLDYDHIILDGEIVAMDDNNKCLSYSESRQKVNYNRSKFIAFDCITNEFKPYKERFNDINYFIGDKVTKIEEYDRSTDFDVFQKQMLSKGYNEGFILRDIDGFYEFDKRSKSSLKWKYTFDSIECKAIKALKGNNVDDYFNSFEIRIKNTNEPIGKVGTGLSHDILRDLTNEILEGRDFDKTDYIDLNNFNIYFEVENGGIFTDNQGNKSFRFPRIKELRMD